MAHEGQVVKLSNGRWARFSHVDLQGTSHGRWDGAILVAVELEDRYQSMLDAASHDAEDSYDRGVPVQLTLASDGRGAMAVRLEEAAAT